MLLRKFDPQSLDSEPEKVLYKDIYPWDEIQDTPFGASLAIVQPGGQTILHSHDPDETFIIFQGHGTMVVDEESRPIAKGDVVVMPSGTHHTIKNGSETEDLMFLSVFWWTDETDTHSYRMFADGGEDVELAPPPPRLIFPSPPTSNGPLHVGHLAGPYIIADVIRRFDAISGRNNSIFLCMTDDHQSYTQNQADEEGKPVVEVCDFYSKQIQACLRNCSAEPDIFVTPRNDDEYKDSVKAAFQKLYDGGFIKSEEQDVFYCTTCERDLFDGYACGICPHCGESSLGFACESCCLPNKTVDLGEPECTKCEKPPEIRKGTRLVFDLAPCRQAMSQYHSYLKLSPRLKRLSSQYLALEELKVPAAAPSSWGIPVPVEGFEDQVISPWLEIGLANHFLRKKAGHHQDVVHCFGYDNAFCYLMSDPGLSLAMDQTVPLATELVANHYLSLNDVKMSTSKGHYLSPDILLSRMPADLLRFYLALVRPEVSETSCSLRHLADTVNSLLVERLQNWLADLGKSVTEEFASSAPEFEDWSEDHDLFYADLNEFSRKAKKAYENRQLQVVARTAIEVMNRSISFGNDQFHLANVPAYASERATGVALELAAARLLSTMLYPIMPAFGAQLWKILGNHQAMDTETWPAEVELLEPGQRLLARAGLCAKRFFPQAVNLDDMIETESDDEEDSSNQAESSEE